MKKKDGDIEWTVTEERREGVLVHVLRFEPLTKGLHKGQYHPNFWLLPMVFLSQFIEPTYSLWEAYCGQEVIDSNIVYVGSKIATQKELEPYL